MVISRLDREGTPVPRHLVSPAQLLSSVISEAEEMSCVVKGSSAYLRENDAFIGGEGGFAARKLCPSSINTGFTQNWNNWNHRVGIRF